MPEKQAFGDILAALRQAKGLTQQEVGDLIGVTRSAVYGFEKGRSFPVPDKLVKLARYFEVTVDYMLTGEEATIKASFSSSSTQNVQDSGTSDHRLAGAGEPGISSELIKGEWHGADANEPGFSYGLAEKPKRKPGMDVVEQLEQHSNDIKKLEAAVRRLQGQLKNS